MIDECDHQIQCERTFGCRKVEYGKICPLPLSVCAYKMQQLAFRNLAEGKGG